MTRLLLILLLLAAACSKKKERPAENKSFARVKLFIQPRDKLTPAQINADLALLKKRMSQATPYSDLTIEGDKELYIALKVANESDKRVFLRAISPLLTKKGGLTLFEVHPWGEHLAKERPATVHLVKVMGALRFRSVAKATLLEFLEKLNAPTLMQRVPKGVYDFSKSYWVAFKAGPALSFTQDPQKPGVIALEARTHQKSVAVVLDSYILQLIKSPLREVRLKDATGRLKPKQLEAILAHGPLKASWRIARIEASQNL